MFERRVLGVDPGVARLGLAVVDTEGRAAKLIWAGTVVTPADADESLRLRRLCEAVRRRSPRTGRRRWCSSGWRGIGTT